MILVEDTLTLGNCLCVASCRNGERTAPHAHQRWAGAALQPNEHHTTGALLKSLHESNHLKEIFTGSRLKERLVHKMGIIHKRIQKYYPIYAIVHHLYTFATIHGSPFSEWRSPWILISSAGGTLPFYPVCFLQQSRPIQSRFLQSRNLNCIALCEGNNKQQVVYRGKMIRRERRWIPWFYSVWKAKYLCSQKNRSKHE